MAEIPDRGLHLKKSDLHCFQESLPIVLKKTNVLCSKGRKHLWYLVACRAQKAQAIEAMKTSSSGNARQWQQADDMLLDRIDSSCHMRACMRCSEGIRRSWCPEARLAEHREAQALAEEAEKKQRSANSTLFGAPAPPPCVRSEFPSLKACP